MTHAGSEEHDYIVVDGPETADENYTGQRVLSCTMCNTEAYQNWIDGRCVSEISAIIG